MRLIAKIHRNAALSNRLIWLPGPGHCSTRRICRTACAARLRSWTKWARVTEKIEQAQDLKTDVGLEVVEHLANGIVTDAGMIKVHDLRPDHADGAHGSGPRRWDGIGDAATVYCDYSKSVYYRLPVRAFHSVD